MTPPTLTPGPNGDQYVAQVIGTRKKVYVHAPRWYDAREAAVSYFACERHELEVTLCQPPRASSIPRLRVWFQGSNGRYVRRVEKVVGSGKRPSTSGHDGPVSTRQRPARATGSRRAGR